MKSFVYFRGATGLNNVVDPIRIMRDENTLIGDLAEAYNVDIDNSGRVSRRKGYTTTPFRHAAHSMFAEKEYCLFVSESALYRLQPDYSTIGLRSGLTEGAKMDYAYINKTVYYANGYEIGYVKDNLSYIWKNSAVAGEPDFRQFSDPPIGHLVCYHNGRMYVAQDNVIWFSEPFAFGTFDLARNYYSFSGRITAMRGVAGGIYASDITGTYFISTRTDARFSIDRTQVEQKRVYEYPIIAGSAVIGDGISLQIKDTYGDVLICATEKGICVGDSDGKFTNITIEKVTYPAALDATATIVDGCYLCLLHE